MLVDQHDDLAAGYRTAIVQLQIFSLAQISGKRANTCNEAMPAVKLLEGVR